MVVCTLLHLEKKRRKYKVIADVVNADEKIVCFMENIFSLIRIFLFI